MFQYYKETSNHSDDRIKKIIARLDEDSREEEARDAIDELKTIRSERQEELLQSLEKQRVDEAKAAEQRTLELISAIDTTSFIHPQRKPKIKSFFFDPLQIEGQSVTQFNYYINSILQKPEHQAQLADILLDYNPQSGFNMERFEKRSATKKTQSFRDLLEAKLDPKSRTSSGSLIRTKEAQDQSLDLFFQ